jgi:hypothetical protein
MASSQSWNTPSVKLVDEVLGVGDRAFWGNFTRQSGILRVLEEDADLLLFWGGRGHEHRLQAGDLVLGLAAPRET